jgi:hypothetical protein
MNEKTFHSLRRGRSPASGDAPLRNRLRGALVSSHDRFVVQYEAGRPFRSEAGQRSDLMSATGCLLSQIEVMMFRMSLVVK